MKELTEEQVLDYLKEHPGTVGRFLGRIKSPKKSAASRRNGLLARRKKPDNMEQA